MVVEHNKGGASVQMKVLFQNRSTALTHRGGDTVLMERLAHELERRNVSVTVDLEGTADPGEYDVVHLFNFALPEMLRQWGERAYRAGVPFVVSTLAEDLPAFHNRSHGIAQVLQGYVAQGGSREWYVEQLARVASIPPAQPFDNEWVVRHAAALLPNGPGEASTIERQYGAVGTSSVVPVGFDQPRQVDAERFVRAYGVRDFVLCVGRLETRKNQLMLLKALEASDLPVVLAGGGFSYQPDYERAVRSFRRKGKTLIIERLSEEMLASAYAAARVHALPSWYELPGLVTLEAAWHGKNVVATDLGTTYDYLEEDAFYCDPACERSVMNAVFAAYYSPAREGLRERVTQYSWDRAADAVTEVYCRVAKPKAKPATSMQSMPFLSSLPQGVPAPGKSTFDELLRDGEEAGRAGQSERALELLAKAETIDPRSVRVLKARGAILLSQSNITEAQRYFQRALEVDGEDPKSLTGFGMCELLKDNAAGAYPYFVQALRRDVSHLVTIRQLMECAYKLGRFDDLSEVLTRYTQVNPSDAEMWFCLAGSLYKEGRMPEARSAVQKVVAIKTEHRGANELRGLIEKAEQESMESSIKRVAESVPGISIASLTPSASGDQQYDDFDSIDAEIVRLEEEKRKRNLSDVKAGASRILADAAARREQREVAELLLCEVAVLEGRVQEAQRHYDEILSRNARSARALCGKGALAASDGEWARAEAFFREASQLEPGYDVAYAGLGLCAHFAKDLTRAWDWYQRALERNPENMRALLGVIEIGYALRKLPEIEEAILNYLEHHPADLDFLYSLAGCYYAQERLDDAVREIEKITLFQPQHERALELRRLVAEKKNQHGAGLNQW